MLNFLNVFVSVLFDLMNFAILARVLLSWAPGFGGNIRYVLHDITEPVLGIFRRLIPRMGMIDISPIIAIFALDIAKSLLLSLINYLGALI